MNPTQIKAVLHDLGGGANKRLGQHFLIDKVALETIVQAADIRRANRVLEVGPGLGFLTRALLDREADVVAIEQDRRFVEYLLHAIQNPVGTQHAASLRVIHGDAATIHWHSLIGEGSWKFVSNLPYSITSLALRKALWAPQPPHVVVVLIQREVAERALGREKTSLLSLMVALACSSSRIVRRVPPGAFFPSPKVDSAILQLVPITWEERQKIWGIDPEKIMAVAKQGFAHPRKLLASNLGGEKARLALKNIGLSEKARAEELSPENWAQLAIFLSTP